MANEPMIELKPVTDLVTGLIVWSAAPDAHVGGRPLAIRHRMSVHAARADKLPIRLRAASLDNTLDAEIHKLARVDGLILDNFALRPLAAVNTNDFYELIVERRRNDSTIVASSGQSSEWLPMTSHALPAQSAVDRLTSGAHALIIKVTLLDDHRLGDAP